MVSWARAKTKDQEGAPWHMCDTRTTTMCKIPVGEAWLRVATEPPRRLVCRPCIRALVKQRSRVRVR